MAYIVDDLYIVSKFEAYVDGSYMPGIGCGYGGIVYDCDCEKAHIEWHGPCGGEEAVHAELAAIAAAAQFAVRKHIWIDIYTDSEQAIRVLRTKKLKRADPWAYNSWQDFWAALYHQANEKVPLRIRHVKGHSGHHGNNRAHLLARRGVRAEESQHTLTTNTFDITKYGH
jgi:ribonuclease HI